MPMHLQDAVGDIPYKLLSIVPSRFWPYLSRPPRVLAQVAGLPTIRLMPHARARRAGVWEQIHEPALLAEHFRYSALFALR